MALKKQQSTGKDSARERDKKKSRKYGQAELKHSKKGKLSCSIAVCILFLMILMISASYIQKGDVNILIGLVGLFTLVLSWTGLVTAVRGFKEREKNYLTCKIGIGVNGMFLVGLISIFLRGLF